MQCSFFNVVGDCSMIGRGDPTRTGDHLVPNQVRYQLRYTPKASVAGKSGAKLLLFHDICKRIAYFFLSGMYFVKKVANSNV